MRRKDENDYLALLDELELCGDDDIPPDIRLEMVYDLIAERRNDLYDDYGGE